MIFMHIYKHKTFDRNVNNSLLLSNLSKYLDKDKDEIEITKNENGKPKTKGIFFSVSHSHNYLLQVFTKSSDIGVDIEKITQKRNYLKLASRYFSKLESKNM